MKSIRSALVLRLTLSGLGLLLVVGVALCLRLRTVLTEEFDTALRARAQAMATLVTERDGRVEFDFADELMPEFSRSRRPDYFELFLADGSVVERARSLRGQDLPFPGAERAAGSCQDARLADGRTGRVCAIDLVPQRGEDERGEGAEAAPEPGAPGSFVLVLARGREPVDHVMSAVTTWVVVAGATFALLSALLVRGTVVRGLQPLERFSTAVRALRTPDEPLNGLSLPLPAELEPVRRRLVETLQRLADAFEREKRFTAAAAHELRTPIAELKSIAQYALKWPEDPEDARQTTHDVLALAQRMERLVSTMLAIARSESSERHHWRETVPIEPLLASALTGLEERSRERGVAWEVCLEPGLQAWSDRELLETLLGNLLENALEHGLADHPVALVGEGSGAGLSLSVRNRCELLDPELVRHACEPFWRGPRRASRRGHAGLGLSLAAATAAMLSASLELSLEEEGTIFVARLWLPREVGAAPSTS